MEQLMKAVIRSAKGLEFSTAPQPVKAEAGHLLIKMICCGINPGDLAFIHRPLPPGSVLSLYDIYGVSGVGEVLEIGAGVPVSYSGKKVTMYRSLSPSKRMVGTWSAYAHVPYLDCAILPDEAQPEEYAGSMVNIITPYAFLKQVMAEGHRGIISTAGTSATGIAMAGICNYFDFPLISIVRKKEGKAVLEALGAKNVAVREDATFKTDLAEQAKALGATAIFDGVGGEVLNDIIEAIPPFSTIFSYGYLGDDTPLTVQLRTLTAKGLTIRPFANFRTPTVQDPANLALALEEIGRFIDRPHFKTKVGKKFGLGEIEAALAFSDPMGAKAILYPA